MAAVIAVISSLSKVWLKNLQAQVLHPTYTLASWVIRVEVCNVPEPCVVLLIGFCREKQEEEERKRLGIEKEDSADDEIVNGDPFKPLDLETLKKKVCFFEPTRSCCDVMLVEEFGPLLAIFWLALLDAFCFINIKETLLVFVL